MQFSAFLCKHGRFFRFVYSWLTENLPEKFAILRGVAHNK